MSMENLSVIAAAINWEWYWEVVGTTASALKIGIAGLFFYRYIKPFLPENRSTVYVGAVYTAVMIFFKFCPYEFHAETCFAVSIAAGFLAMCILDDHNTKQKIFLSMSWFLLEWMTWGFTLIPWGYLYKALILAPGMMERRVMQFVFFVLVQCGYLALNYIFFSVFIKIMHKAFQNKQEIMSGKELVLMLAPSISMFTGYRWLHFASDVYEKDTGVYLEDIHPKYVLLQAMYMAISYASILTAVVSYQQIKDSQRREKQDAVLTRQMEDMKKYIREVEHLYVDIRSMKHDMGNHVMILENLYAGQREHQQETGEYLAQLKYRVQKVAEELCTGNPVTDVILREKQKEAKEKGIAFECQFHYPQNTDIGSFDIGIVLSNACNNAIEAAVKCHQPYICISSYYKRNIFILDIKNSADGWKIPNPETGIPPTEKTGGEHGFGLINIRNVARKYCGDIDIRQDGKEFGLYVMFQLQRR